MRDKNKVKEIFGSGHLKQFALEDVDIIDIMTAVVEGHVKHYQEDFYQGDKVILGKAALSDKAESYIWLVRESGTWILSEREIFIKDTKAQEQIRYYVEWEPDAVIAAFEIKVKGMQDDIIYGDICTVDLDKYYRVVKALGQEIKAVVFQYEGGCVEHPVGTKLQPGIKPHPEYGKFLYFDYLAEDESAIERILAMGWMNLLTA